MDPFFIINKNNSFGGDNMKIYDWDEEIVLDALRDFAHQWCGEQDEQFLTDCCIEAYVNPAWEACVVMDYIDRKLGPMLQSATQQAQNDIT
jgi:hypothetical protein